MNNKLNLVWKSESGESYNVGELAFTDEKYYFQYNLKEVKRAAMEGFTPLEGFPRINAKYFREELFTTFEGWIGEKANKEEEIVQVLKNIVNDKFHFLHDTEAS